MILDEQKLIFIHIPKTGGTSFEFAYNYIHPGFDQFINPFLIKNLTQETDAHIPAIVLKKSFPEKFDSYYKFCIVRNPWDRLLSSYLWIKRYQLKTNIGFRDWIISGFKDTPEREMNIFVNFNQLDWITDNSGNIIIDYIGQFDQIKQEFVKINQKLKIPKQKLPYINASRHIHYSYYYDDETKDIVREMYQKDIEYFGFKYKTIR